MFVAVVAVTALTVQQALAGKPLKEAVPEIQAKLRGKMVRFGVVPVNRTPHPLSPSNTIACAHLT